LEIINKGPKSLIQVLIYNLYLVIYLRVACYKKL